MCSINNPVKAVQEIPELKQAHPELAPEEGIMRQEANTDHTEHIMEETNHIGADEWKQFTKAKCALH